MSGLGFGRVKRHLGAGGFNSEVSEPRTGTCLSALDKGLRVLGLKGLRVSGPGVGM